MTTCCMTGKKVVCPECGGSEVALHYNIDATHIYCQNNMGTLYLNEKTGEYEPYCKSLGRFVFHTYHHSHPEYPKVIKKCQWAPCGYPTEQFCFDLNDNTTPWRVAAMEFEKREKQTEMKKTKKLYKDVGAMLKGMKKGA